MDNCPHMTLSTITFKDLYTVLIKNQSVSAFYRAVHLKIRNVIEGAKLYFTARTLYQVRFGEFCITIYPQKITIHGRWE